MSARIPGHPLRGLVLVLPKLQQLQLRLQLRQ